MTLKIRMTGIVQGIGFRPNTQRLAYELNIFGEVKNTGGNVEIIAQSKNKQALNTFVQRLDLLSGNATKTVEETESEEYNSFTITHSSNDNDLPIITPDIATCKRCEKELLDRNNRRRNHPFISCIDCGPRYSIINSLPYDRQNITMAEFELCENCQKEYTEIENIRCHAQTIACNDCGPKLNIEINKAIEILKNENVLAIKDIGGYHFACLANSEKAVAKIREIKMREEKPFAVMFKDIEEIEKYCFLNNKEKELLLSPARPIVLLKKKKDFAKGVCSESSDIGAFLPCNPVQILLLNECKTLVMTSGNISGEPIITDNKRIENLKSRGFYVLSHNREICTPLDDSILRVTKGRVQFIRRARGYVPLPIELDVTVKKEILAKGGDLKSSFCLVKNNLAFMSQYFGDLENEDCFDKYQENIKRLEKLENITPRAVACDKHPLYYSAEKGATYKWQHHHAHIASVMAEHHLKKVLGFAFDGTGYGDDGSVWGSEVLICDGAKYERCEHLTPVKMLGGDNISKDANTVLDCYLGGNALIDAALKNNINTVYSSSMGRLFDAVSALLGISNYNNYEGKCSILLEECAKKSSNPYFITPSWNGKEILEEIKIAKEKAKTEDIALGFHKMLAELILETAKNHNIKDIALSGGVFANRILTEMAIDNLENSGFNVYINEKVPMNDGGIALGQAYLSALSE